MEGLEIIYRQPVTHDGTMLHPLQHSRLLTCHVSYYHQPWSTGMSQDLPECLSYSAWKEIFPPQWTSIGKKEGGNALLVWKWNNMFCFSGILCRKCHTKEKYIGVHWTHFLRKWDRLYYCQPNNFGCIALYWFALSTQWHLIKCRYLALGLLFICFCLR